MSVISFPRRPEVTVRPTRRVREAPPRRERQVRRVPAPATREVAFTSKDVVAVNPLVRRCLIVVAVAVLLLVGGMFENGQRQVRLLALQNELQAEQSTVAMEAATVSNMSAPSVVASFALSHHLVQPLSVNQIPATSLSHVLALPTFTRPVVVTARSQR